MKQMKLSSRFFFPPSLKCRLSIINREVRQALEAENIKVDESLIDRCVDVGVGAIGTASPTELISVAYNLYKQQLATSDIEKERASRKHFAVKYMDETIATSDRIFCYIMFKMPSETPLSTRNIRDVVKATKRENFHEWKEIAYSTFTSIPPVSLSIRVILENFYIASIRSLIADDYRFVKEKDIECIVLYSEFLDCGFDIKKELPLLGSENFIVIDTPMVLSLQIDIFTKIHKWRSNDMCVCMACDSDGLTVSGLVAARYLSLITRCNHSEAIKAVKIAHESFVPRPYASKEFVAIETESEEAYQIDLRVPTSESMKIFDRRMLDNSIRSLCAQN